MNKVLLNIDRIRTYYWHIIEEDGAYTWHLDSKIDYNTWSPFNEQVVGQIRMNVILNYENN
jgi:hypothetical protein